MMGFRLKVAPQTGNHMLPKTGHFYFGLTKRIFIVDFISDLAMLCMQSSKLERKYRGHDLIGVNLMKQRTSLEILKRPLIILIFALLIAGGLFFWYEYRPSVIRAECSIEAEKRADKNEYVYEIIYRHCLRMHGIEYPEKIE